MERNEADCGYGCTWAGPAPTTEPFVHPSMSRPGQAETTSGLVVVTGDQLKKTSRGGAGGNGTRHMGPFSGPRSRNF